MDRGTVLVAGMDKRTAAHVVVSNHYLHRRPPISFAFGLYRHGEVVGAVTYGTPPSRQLQMSVCPTDPSLVVELNRLWVDDAMPRNTESWFVSRSLRMLPPRLVVSYADPLWGHYGYVYRALNFHYAGWTDMDRKTPRYDYLPANPRTHTRDAFRNGYVSKRRRVAKIKYWIATGDHSQRRQLTKLCGWPIYDWKWLPPPSPEQIEEEIVS